jgi:COP9 signalosome complex subunit 4
LFFMAGTIQGVLQGAAGISDQKQKIDHYKMLLSSIIATNNVQHAKDFIDHMMTDEVPLVASRQLLQIFATDLSKLEPEAHKEVAQYALLQIQHRVVSFEEQVLF